MPQARSCRSKKGCTPGYIPFLAPISVFWLQKGNAANEPPQIVRTAQKGTYVEKYEVLSGEAARQRCLSSFELDALMVVEVDIPVNHLVCLRKRGRFVPVNALCLED